MTHDVMKRQLKPLDRFDAYGLIPFTDLQWERLQEAFPRRGVRLQQAAPVGHPPSLAWATYTDGPGGQPMGDPPASTPLPATD